jgi:hypothetical protein
MKIIWHHVGREHGRVGDYAPDLRLNTPHRIEEYISDKLSGSSENRYIRYDSNTLVELPPICVEQRWIIVYCLDCNLQFSLGYKPHPWWLADVVSYRRSEAGEFIVRDLFLDVEIDEDLQYRVLDREDFEFAATSGIIDSFEADLALVALDRLVQDLDSKAFPWPSLVEAQRTYWGT